MKFFFYSHDSIDPAEKEKKNIDRLFEGIGYGFLASVLDSDMEAESDSLFKRIYDAADIIADKRCDNSDDELNHMAELADGKEDYSKSNNLYYRVIDHIRIKSKSSGQDKSSDNDDANMSSNNDTSKKRHRLPVLKGLFEMAQSIAADKDIDKIVNSDDENRTQKNRLRILYLLCIANVCLRISQVYHETSDFQSSTEWGDKAGELIWHGKCLTEQELEKGKVRDVEMKLYRYALHLNLATYYLNYARKNRRSNYSSAKDELEVLFTGYSREDWKHINGNENEGSYKRSFALIYIDAKLMQYSIRRIQREEDEKEVLKEFKIFEGAFYGTINSNQLSEYNEIFNVPDVLELIKALGSYDKNRSILLIKLHIARFHRDMHSSCDYIENYKNAIQMGQEAIVLSREMDINAENKNMDAVIIISSALRKLILRESYDAAKGYLSKKLSFNADHNLLFNATDSISGAGINLGEMFHELKIHLGDGYYDAISECMKWCYLNMTLEDNHQKRITGVSEYPKYDDISEYFNTKSTENQNDTRIMNRSTVNKDLRLRFLEGIFYLKSGLYDKAEEVFLDLLEGETYRKLTSYIRPGTIGLKSRYLIARTYLSKGNLEKAKDYLEEIQDAIRQFNVSKDEEDQWYDHRTTVDLVYCYIRQGNHEGAYLLFEEVGLKNTYFYSNAEKNNNVAPKNEFDINDKNNPNELFLSTLSNKRRISGLNNLIRCCLFSEDKESKDGKLRIRIARNVIEYLRKKQRASNGTNEIPYDADSETDLLEGYCCILESDTADSKAALKEALKLFENACNYYGGFTLTLANRSSDRSRQRHLVEYLSAYLITVIRLYKIAKKEVVDDKESEDYEKRLIRFLSGISKRVEISMNAAIVLAEWLLEYVKKNNENKENKKDIDQLFRSFCYVTIYDERGARVFNQLKDNQDFRLLESRYRGKIIALLLAMYKPIKALKEECQFNLDSFKLLKKHEDKEEMDLVHYTGFDTLKKLLPINIDKDSDCSAQTNLKSRFRINNCGYMNDVFEGSIFFRCFKEVARLDEIDYNNMIFKFFPYLKRTETDRKPMASNVYIGSLSVKPDSFPIWQCYADREKGCNISFGEGFFDINGAQYYPHQLREYIISSLTDDSYPLYIVQYIKSEKELKKQINSIYFKETMGDALDEYDIPPHKTRKQTCGTRAIDYGHFCRLLRHIYLRWKKLDKELNEIESRLKTGGDDTYGKRNNKGTTQIEGRINLARQFTADRLNEIRFLFKDADYEFESEVRIVHTEADSSNNAHIDYDRYIPKPYTDIDRELEGLTITLGSRIPDSDVDMIVTWLKKTGRVKTVKLSTRNRYIMRTTE